jgi:response regulator of citrate/malate metabolism
MIRTLVVDDDFMAVQVHRELIERVPGFTVVGEARSGRQALAQVEALRPDLVMLDIYLPDMSGIEVMRRMRATPEVTADIIAITSAKDIDILRSSMSLGVVHYIVKPFTFRVLRERLESYAAASSRLDAMERPGQRDIDRVFGLLRTNTEHTLPKGISAPTLELVADIVRDSPHGITSADVADRAGFSPGVARRYLRHLVDAGTMTFTLRYGSTGRPEHIYHWDGTPPTG